MDERLLKKRIKDQDLVINKMRNQMKAYFESHAKVINEHAAHIDDLKRKVSKLEYKKHSLIIT